MFFQISAHHQLIILTIYMFLNSSQSYELAYQKCFENKRKFIIFFPNFRSQVAPPPGLPLGCSLHDTDLKSTITPQIAGHWPNNRYNLHKPQSRHVHTMATHAPYAATPQQKHWPPHTVGSNGEFWLACNKNIGK